MTTAEVFDQLHQRLLDPGDLAELMGTYQFHLTGEDGGDYVVTVDHQGVHMAAGVAPAPGVAVTIAAADFKELALGQLNPMTAFMSGKLSVAGDMSLALKLQSMLGKQ